MDAKLSGHRAPGEAASTRGAVCLVLISPNGPRPEPLLTGLKKRGADTIFVTHPAQVMVRLASCPRAAVIIDQSSSSEDCVALRRAVARYYPNATLWMYDVGTDPACGRLTRVSDETRRQAIVRQKRNGTASTASVDGLRLRSPDTPEAHHPYRHEDTPAPAIDEPSMNTGPSETYERVLGTSQIVSADELAMLMDPGTDDPEPSS